MLAAGRSVVITVAEVFPLAHRSPVFLSYSCLPPLFCPRLIGIYTHLHEATIAHETSVWVKWYGVKDQTHMFLSNHCCHSLLLVVTEAEDNAKRWKGMGQLALTENLKSTFNVLNCQYRQCVERGAMWSVSVASSWKFRIGARWEGRAWKAQACLEPFQKFWDGDDWWVFQRRGA